MATASIPANFVPAKEGEIINLGRGVTCRILEDGSRTGESNRPQTTLRLQSDLSPDLSQTIALDLQNSPFLQTHRVRRLTGTRW